MSVSIVLLCEDSQTITACDKFSQNVRYSHFKTHIIRIFNIL